MFGLFALPNIVSSSSSERKKYQVQYILYCVNETDGMSGTKQSKFARLLNFNKSINLFAPRDLPFLK